MTDECLELKNIKYQTMLLNNNSKTISTTPNILNIEHFLKKEQELSKKKPWNKLGKAIQLKRIYIYIDEYCKKNKYNNNQKKKLKLYLLTCLDRKKLQRQKDIIYDIKTNKIKNIPGLIFNKKNNKFTLKRKEKKTSTLKCLAPKKPKREKRKKKDKMQKNTKTKKKTVKQKTKNQILKIDKNLKDK